MPSPIAHVTAGYVLYRIFRKWHRHFSASGWRVFLLFAGLSLAPDLDTILGMVFGDLGEFHNNITHSLLAAIPVSACVYLFLKVTRLNPAVPWAVATAACYGMHVAMDFFSHGRGIMAFWPITSERFISPVLLFYGLHWSEGWLSASHLVTIATEGIPSAIAIGIAYYALRNKTTGAPMR